MHSQPAPAPLEGDRLDSNGHAHAIPSEPNCTMPKQSGVEDNSHTVAGLDHRTIQQHTTILTARLQSQLGQGRSGGMSDSETDADQTIFLPADFKTTLVDSTGPIPGLEDV